MFVPVLLTLLVLVIVVIGLFVVVIVTKGKPPQGRALDSKYKKISKKDEDFKNLWDDEDFKKIVE